MRFAEHLNFDQRRERITHQRLAAARDALVGYAVSHGRLPRPAASSRDGKEAEVPCSTDADCTGFIPWVTLGIDGVDGWWHLLRYSVTPALTGQEVQRDVVPNRTVARRLSNGDMVYVVGQDECSSALLCAPAVVFSTGKNNFGVSPQGLLQHPSTSDGTSIDELRNITASRNYISREKSTDAAAIGGSFDDLVVWVDVGRLLSSMDKTFQLRGK
ncbi:hypothetical protein [Duganella qianjiadongensis]|nr:hypothetical protein [Duganella qianjiadongensis]